jgi:hypothetical protein
MIFFQSYSPRDGFLSEKNIVYLGKNITYDDEWERDADWERDTPIHRLNPRSDELVTPPVTTTSQCPPSSGINPQHRSNHDRAPVPPNDPHVFNPPPVPPPPKSTSSMIIAAAQTARVAEVIIRYDGGGTQRLIPEVPVEGSTIRARQASNLVSGSCQTGDSMVNGEAYNREHVDVTAPPPPPPPVTRTEAAPRSSSTQSPINAQRFQSRPEVTVQEDGRCSKSNPPRCQTHQRSQTTRDRDEELPNKFRNPKELIFLIRECKECNPKQRFRSRRDAVDHQKRVHDAKYCPVCFDRFSRKGNVLKDHFLQFHASDTSKEIAPCPFCRISCQFEGMYVHIGKAHLIPAENELSLSQCDIAQDLPILTPQHHSSTHGQGSSFPPPPIFYAANHMEDEAAPPLTIEETIGENSESLLQNGSPGEDQVAPTAATASAARTPQSTTAKRVNEVLRLKERERQNNGRGITADPVVFNNKPGPSCSKPSKPKPSERDVGNATSPGKSRSTPSNSSSSSSRGKKRKSNEEIANTSDPMSSRSKRGVVQHKTPNS